LAAVRLALATRLSEDAARRVMLMEAGPDEGAVTDADRLGDQMRFSTSLTGWGVQATFAPGIFAELAGRQENGRRIGSQWWVCGVGRTRAHHWREARSPGSTPSRPVHRRGHPA
jgi:hypothetical protein